MQTKDHDIEMVEFTGHAPESRVVSGFLTFAAAGGLLALAYLFGNNPFMML